MVTGLETTLLTPNIISDHKNDREFLVVSMMS